MKDAIFKISVLMPDDVVEAYEITIKDIYRQVGMRNYAKPELLVQKMLKGVGLNATVIRIDTKKRKYTKKGTQIKENTKTPAPQKNTSEEKTGVATMAKMTGAE